MWSYAHLLSPTISTPEIVEHPVRVGHETRMQREHQDDTQRGLPDIVAQGSGAADIEFRPRHITSDPVEAPKGSEDLDDEGFLMLPRSFQCRVASAGCWFVGLWAKREVFSEAIRSGRYLDLQVPSLIKSINSRIASSTYRLADETTLAKLLGCGSSLSAGSLRIRSMRSF
jgi:hypothetical protein